jgi:hypothetical protein
MLNEFIILLKTKICKLIQTQTKIEKVNNFKQFNINWFKTEFDTYFPILYSDNIEQKEIINKNKNKKFITISQQSSEFLKQFYKCLELFYIEYSSILSYYLIFYNLLMDENLIKKLFEEYNLLQYESKREKWWKDKINYFHKLKLEQIKNKGLSASELWFIIDEDFIYLLQSLFNNFFITKIEDVNSIEEEKVEEKEEEKVKKEEVKVKKEEEVKEEEKVDEKIEETEQLIAQLLDEMDIETFDEEEEKRDIQVMRLNDDIIEFDNHQPLINNNNNNLNGRTVAQLREMCKENGIRPIPKTKAELINALTARLNHN